MVTREGIINAYIHTGGRIGVLVELNCQTGSVASSEEFQLLARDLAMQVAASPTADFIAVADVPGEIRTQLLATELEREDLKSKPVQIRTWIAEGRVDKLIKLWSLLEQPFIKEPSITVGELIAHKMSRLGESIRLRRFVRFALDQSYGGSDEDGPEPSSGVRLPPKGPKPHEDGAEELPVASSPA